MNHYHIALCAIMFASACVDSATMHDECPSPSSLARLDGGTRNPTAPMVNITAPAIDDELRGTVHITAYAEHPEGIREVLFCLARPTSDQSLTLDEQNCMIPLDLVRRPPFETVWVTDRRIMTHVSQCTSEPQDADGVYYITARASALTGELGYGRILVSVKNE